MAELSRAVFLSYASEDAEAAQRICVALRAAGIEVWFDKSELRGGDAWDQTIRQRIRDCRLFIPVISAATETRGEGYFRREWKLAVDRTEDMAGDVAFIVPVVIDNTSSASARVPPKFREVQWSRLPGGETSASFVARLAGLQGAEDPRPAAGQASAAMGVVAPPRARSKRAVWSLLGVAALAVAVGGGWLALRQSGLRRPAAADTASRPPAPIKEQSIAVLPFADMSEKKDQEYFADGMAEEILGVLAKVPRLIVISRTSSFQFKARDVDVKTIGAALGTRYVLEGSVRKAGSRVRITAQLIDTVDGAHRWAETYDRDAGDVFSVQDEIAGSIVRALQLAVVGAEEVPARVRPKNPAAYDLYLRGRQAFDRFNRDGFEQAGDLYQQALDLDPEFVPAVNALANVQLFVAQWGYVAPRIGYERARRSAQAVMKLDPHLAEPHAILAAVHLQYDWDWAAAQDEIDRALKLDPRDPQVHALRGLISLSIGRLPDANSELNAALRLDPLSPNFNFNLGWVRFWSGHLPEAETALRKALQISPTYESAHYYLGHVLLARGELTKALAQMEQELDEESRIAGIAAVQFAMGHKKEADAALAQLSKQGADEWASGIASLHAIRNEPDDTFKWLERAYAQKDEDLYLIKGNPLYRNLARDPRYTAFLRKMNLPE
jgi:TolB-like protein/tetratricopeptide (TPR) repeat protein